ncbi:MAG: hypothetical protein WD601_05035 [Pseudohongiellaceae bacterium]
MKAAIEEFIARENLPENYYETVQLWFIPMLEQLLQKVAVNKGTFVVGISGCQGSGKSTLASLLVILLRETMGLNSINLSLDDFYLTHSERAQLAAKTHPLLATRGVPGTHDVALAIRTIQALKQPGQVPIVRFNKALDDRAPEHAWPVVQAPVDVIILEGWCLNIPEQNELELQDPINELEQQHDRSGIWRQYVNDRIRADYRQLYDLVDYLIMLKAPSFEKVFQWRQTQEDKLAESQQDLSHSKIMSPKELKRFIQHYERITRHGLATLPARADVVFQLTDEQTIKGRA